MDKNPTIEREETHQTATVGAVGAVLCPPKVLDTMRALTTLGVLYSLERLIPAKSDNLLDLFQAVVTLGAGDDAPVRFEWADNSIVVVVPDMLELALAAPEINKTLHRIEKAGFVVKNELRAD